jgi:hypothetical protein
LFPVPSQHQARCLHTSFKLRSIGWALIVERKAGISQCSQLPSKSTNIKDCDSEASQLVKPYRATNLIRRHDQKTKRVSERCGTSSPTQFGWRFCQPAGSICVERTLLASRECIRRWAKDTNKRLTEPVRPIRCAATWYYV